jgi:hypothetical protein
MNCEEVIKLIKAWLGDVQDGHLSTQAFVQVVESLIEVYERNKKDA